MARRTPRRAHPFPAKLTRATADEIRALHRNGAAVKELARRFGVARSSISAILQMHVYVPEYVVMLSLCDLRRSVLAEIARDEKIAEAELASALLSKALDEVTVCDDVRGWLNARR